MKRPAFQFYPSDWRKDMALQSCSVAARGLWVDMMCIAHECEPYGHLTVNGKPMTNAQIGRHTGLTERECAKLVAELEAAGVPSRTPEGVLFSRRMVRDEEVRQRRAEGGKGGSEFGHLGAEHGAKGGRPKKAKGGINNPPSVEQEGGEQAEKKPPLEPPPSSSSSSSTSSLRSEVLSQTLSRPEPEVLEPPDLASAEALPGWDVVEAEQAPLAASAAIAPAAVAIPGSAATPAAQVGLALRAVGADMTRLNTADPRFSALLAQGATPHEFAGLWAEAVAKGIDKPFGWVLTVLPKRRAEAQALTLAPQRHGVPQQRSRSAQNDRIAGAARAMFDGADHV